MRNKAENGENAGIGFLDAVRYVKSLSPLSLSVAAVMTFVFFALPKVAQFFSDHYQ